MKTSIQGSELKFSSPASYRICIKGYLDESWSGRLIGMTIDNEVRSKETPIVALSGQVRDQSELLGVLNSLYEMHLPLVSIELVDLEIDKQ